MMKCTTKAAIANRNRTIRTIRASIRMSMRQSRLAEASYSPSKGFGGHNISTLYNLDDSEKYSSRVSLLLPPSSSPQGINNKKSHQKREDSSLSLCQSTAANSIISSSVDEVRKDSLKQVSILKFFESVEAMNYFLELVGDSIFLEKIKMLEEMQNKILYKMVMEESNATESCNEKYLQLNDILTFQDILALDCPSSLPIHSVFEILQTFFHNFQTSYDRWVEILRSLQDELLNHLVAEYDAKVAIM